MIDASEISMLIFEGPVLVIQRKEPVHPLIPRLTCYLLPTETQFSLVKVEVFGTN
jgi:hypothetical protein